MGFLNWCAAGPLSGFIGFQNWRMAPLKGFPKPKMSLELALAMLRLAPWLVLWCFKTDARLAFCGFMGFENWRMAPCPDLKGFPRPKMSLELALAMLRLAPWLVLWVFKTDGWPPLPIPKAFPTPKMSLELALAMLRLTPSLVLWDFKTDGWPLSRRSPGPKCCWSWL